MIKQLFSNDWHLSAPEFSGKVDLPNDYSIAATRRPDAPGGASNGFFTGGIGKYTKYFTLPEGDEHILLDIEGAYCLSEVYFNEDAVNFHVHGYTPHLVDLTEKARRGFTNKLMIKTNDMQPSTRWYAGAGLYRDVYLWTGGRVRIEPWDCFVKTARASGKHAELEIDYKITSDVENTAFIKGVITSPSGKINSFELTVPVMPGKNEARVHIGIDCPELWDTENPNIYSLETKIYVCGELTDTANDSFGIRTISADALHGLRLNGKEIKLRGGCLHHTHGILGSADYYAAVERQVLKLKSVGYNALRSSHNPPSLSMLEICDKHGIILMDEAFDMWRMQKNHYDYHIWFEKYWAEDIERMVLRDRNHPSVISYSIGNEILERARLSDGAVWAKRLADEVRKHDSTRLVTSGICSLWGKDDAKAPEDYREFLKTKAPNEECEPSGAWGAQTAEYMSALDIVGYNYLHTRYTLDHKFFPDRVMWGSETWAITFYDSWKYTAENSYVIGDFCWTCYDSLGESGTGRFAWARDGVIDGISLAGFDWISCYQGDFDLAGYRRPQSYFREAIWKGCTAEPRIFTTHPEHYGEGFTGTQWHWYDVHETWTFDGKYIGKPVKVETYTLADSAKWYLNGKYIGESVPEKAIAAIDIPYEKGSLKVVLYKDGKECGEYTLSTVKDAEKLVIEAEKSEFKADGRDLCYFDITVTDIDGKTVTECRDELVCSAEGCTLMGIFSGNPQSTDKYTSNICHLFEGHATACVKTKTPGEAKITIEYKGKKYTAKARAI